MLDVEEETITKTKKKSKTQTKTLPEEERQTIVHCTYRPDMAVRVWPSTFLIEKEGGRKVKLITAFNIAFAPEWTHALNGHNKFTLIFEGLSKGCTMFDLMEIIPLPDPFVVRNIARNKSDVYHVQVD
jgi:hypothetical protein